MREQDKELNITLKSWDYTCGDGCCYDYGLDIYVNGEKLDESNADDSENALKAVLEHLGYKINISHE
jgi:hypothetical protein